MEPNDDGCFFGFIFLSSCRPICFDAQNSHASSGAEKPREMRAKCAWICRWDKIHARIFNFHQVRMRLLIISCVYLRPYTMIMSVCQIYKTFESVQRMFSRFKSSKTERLLRPNLTSSGRRVPPGGEKSTLLATSTTTTCISYR